MWETIVAFVICCLGFVVFVAWMDHRKARSPHPTRPHRCPACERLGVEMSVTCHTCWGWGWLVEPATCEHRYRPSKNVGRCRWMWVCEFCRDEKEVDSSG